MTTDTYTQDTDQTIVVFRWDDGEVCALFPEIQGDSNGRYCSCYAHVGQHGSADYTGYVARTRPATPDEYADLRAELESPPYGYRLDIRQRRRSYRFPMQA